LKTVFEVRLKATAELDSKTASMSKAAALELKAADESRLSFEIETVLKPKAELNLKAMSDKCCSLCGVRKLPRFL